MCQLPTTEEDSKKGRAGRTNVKYSLEKTNIFNVSLCFRESVRVNFLAPSIRWANGEDQRPSPCMIERLGQQSDSWMPFYKASFGTTVFGIDDVNLVRLNSFSLEKRYEQIDSWKPFLQGRRMMISSASNNKNVHFVSLLGMKPRRCRYSSRILDGHFCHWAMFF